MDVNSRGTRWPSHRVARWVTLAIGVVLSLVAWVAAGTEGLAGAAIATVVVVGFMSTGLIPMLLARGTPISAGVGAGMHLLTYTLRLAVALLVLVLVGRADFVDPQWVGVTIVATALTWTGVHVWHALRKSRNEPTIDPSPH